MSYTYGNMQDRIADELARTDLTSQIQLAILSAIKFYKRQRFFFTEYVNTFSTVASQAWYSSSDLSDIPNMVEIDNMKVTVSGTIYSLTPRPIQLIEALDSSSSLTADPTDYAYYRQMIRLWPIPGAVRTVTVNYVKELTALSASSDTNAWVDEAEEMIRARAKWDLYLNVLRDDQSAVAMKAAEMEAKRDLDHETAIRASSGRLVPVDF